MHRLLFWGAACLAACATPAHDWSSRLEPDARFRDELHDAVVRVGTWCSGTLVSPRHVLTAAHCLSREWQEVRLPVQAYPPSFPDVKVDDITFRSVACAAHPGAYPGADACHGRPDQNVVRRHDLAVLTLEEDASPTPLHVALEERVLPEAVWLVGWHRRPRRRGALHRYAGQARVRGVHASLLTAEAMSGDPAESFRTHGGNSGGPALVSIGEERLLVGVLSAHSFARVRRSFYAWTASPENARWLRSALASSR